jgi:DNA-binding beta-propeller fold protein YncE
MNCLVSLIALTAVMFDDDKHAQAGEPAPLVLMQTIPLKGAVGNLDHLAVDAKGGRLFVANKANNTLDVVDLQSGTLAKQIPDQVKVSGVAFARDLDMIYVGDGGGVCNGIDAKDYRVVFSTKAEKADNVYYNSDKKVVYVAHGETVSVLDAKTGDAKAQISTGGKTEEFRVDKKANKLFINLRSPSVVAVVDLDNNEVMDRIKLTKTETNGPLAYDAKAGLLFVGCGGKAPMIITVDARSGKELASVDIPAGIDNLHFSSKRNRLYASCGDGVVAVLEKKGDEYAVIAKVETAKKAKTSAYHSDSGRLYVGAPRLEGAEAAKVLVFEERPALEARAARSEK